jgi:type IV pilus assembly protein PilM
MSLPFVDQAKELSKQLFSQAVKKEQGGSVLGVDIGSSSIKLVQLQAKEAEATLETYGEISLGPYADVDVGQSTNLPPQKLAEALVELMKEANVTTKSCGVSVPFASSLVKLIEVPALDTKKLETVVPIEARKYIPVPISEVQLDHFVVPETEQKLFMGARNPDEAAAQKLENRMVLIVAMHNETLRKYTETLRIAELTPSFYEIEVFSSIRSTVARSLAPVAIIDLGAATSKLYLVELGIILASHVVGTGSEDITRSLASTTHMTFSKAEEIKRQGGILNGVHNGDAAHVSHAATLAMEQIFAEARRVLLGFQNKYSKVITKVVLTGGGATLKGVQEFAREQLELEVELANPFHHVHAPAFLEDVLEEAGPEFVVSMGLALRKLQEQQ